MVPCSDALLYAPVTRKSVESLGDLISLGGLWFLNGPHSLSPDLFWWRPERVRRIARKTDHGFDPCWDSEFSATLGRL